MTPTTKRKEEDGAISTLPDPPARRCAVSALREETQADKDREQSAIEQMQAAVQQHRDQQGGR